MHEIERHTNGTAAFVSARVPAWHRLGTVLPGQFTAEQALEHAQLGGWQVRKTPLTTTVITDDGVDTLEVPERYATIRTHPITGQPDVLGVVGEQWTPVQNEDQVAFLNALTDDGGAHLETAGALRGGRQVFFSCKLPQQLLVGGVDPVDLNLVVMNGHDGSMAFRAIVTPVRVVCANTLAAGIARARQSWATRHTAGAAKAIEEARRTLNLAWRYSEAFEAEAQRMIETSLTTGEFEQIMHRVFGAPAELDSPVTKRHKIERLDVLRNLFVASPTATQIRGNRWAAYQAVTEYTDHYAPVRGRRDHTELRALRAVDGALVQHKERAFELLHVTS